MLCADGEEGAEVYGAAKDRDQAEVVYRVAKRMVELSALWEENGGPLRLLDSRKRIIDKRTDSFYQTIAGDKGGNLGQAPHCIVFDEIVAQPNRELWTDLKGGLGKRTQPMMVAATTAGNDPTGFCFEEHEFCQKVAEDPSLDPRRFVYIRNVPMDADPWDEENWKKGSPALGDFLSLETVRSDAQEAKAHPAAENEFRWTRLNQWVEAVTRWIPLEDWDASAGMIDEQELKGLTCGGGIYLASGLSIAAVCWTFPDCPSSGQFTSLWRFLLPEAHFEEFDKRTSRRAKAWVKSKHLKLTAGNVVDYDELMKQIDTDAQRFGVLEVGYARWGMPQLAQKLQDGGLEVVPVTLGKPLAAPLKEWERLIYDKAYRHGGNPVMRWMFDAIQVERSAIDHEPKILPDSSVAGPMAAVLALDRMARVAGTPGYLEWARQELDSQKTGA